MVDPPRAGLTFSLLLRPVTDQLGWVPLLGGLAVVRAVREQAGVDAVLKWPNDVLVGDRKLAGLLAEAVSGAVVLGVGLNVSTHADELPHALATSLAIEGARTTDRETLLKAVLRGLAFTEADRSSYREVCSTLGRDVEVHLPGLTVVQGRADDVDEQGRLVVDGTPYSAGDVVHLR